MNRPKFILIVASALAIMTVVAFAAPGSSTHKPDHNPGPTTASTTPPPSTTTPPPTTSTPAPTTSTASGGGSVGSDFKQCENDDVAPHECVWSGSILQANNADYTEGMSVPQQLILDGLTGTSHSLSFQSQASKGGKHAYDYITSFSQAVAAAEDLRPGDGLMASVDLCIGLNGQALVRCNALRVSANTVDVTAPDNMGFLEGHNIAASVTNYETAFGNRFVEIYASSTASSITGATLAFTGYTGSGDKEANYILNWTSDSSEVMIRWAGHLAIGPDSTLGYGAATGSSSISGGPYHWGLSGLDGGSLGNQANQIQGSDVNAVPASGTITILKDAVPNSLQDFSFSSPTLSPTSFILDDDSTVTGADANRSATQVFSSIAPGTYLITETPVFGWSLSSLSTCSALGTGSSATLNAATHTATIVLGAAGSVSCNFVNNATLPTLNIIKNITNDDGGTLGLADVDLKIDNVEVSNNTATQVSEGAHQVSESAMVGYQASAWSGACNAAGQVTLSLAENATCYITNDDIQPTLLVKKHVIKDHGGAQVAADWTMSVTGTDASPASFPGNESGTLVTLDAGPYSVSESLTPSGYAMSLSADCAGTLQPGEQKICTVTNDDIAPTLLVKKHVINDHGGAQVAADWTMSVTGSDASPASFPGNESGTLVTLDAGTYSVSESLTPSGYAMSMSADCSGSLAPGESKNCTITNDDIQPTLLVKKHVINDDGGTQSAAAWNLDVTGASPSPSSFAGNESGVLVALTANSEYLVGESGPTGYTLSSSEGCSGSLAPGAAAECTLTNDDQEASLTVIKLVVNDNGGSNVSGDWTMSVTATDPSDPSFPGDLQGVMISLDAGSYIVSESGPAGYSASESGCSGELAPGQSATCTFTNDDIKPQLTVIKHVVNDDGGTNVSADWTMSVAGPNASLPGFSGSEAGQLITLDANDAYSIGESDFPAGYAASYSADCSGVMKPGDNKTCTVTNDDIRPTLTVVKHVVNDNGGTRVASEWNMSVSGGASPASFPGNESGTFVSLPANSAYDVTESLLPAGYAASFSADCSGSLLPGETKTCTVTNNDTQPRLTVIKHVVNDNGGLNTSAQWIMDVSGSPANPSTFPGSEAGTLVMIDAGNYFVTESSTPAGYLPSYGQGCSGTLVPGDDVTCIITNDDIPPLLLVKKVVVNDDGGLNTSAQWTMSVSGVNVSDPSFPGNESGTLIMLDANALYSVSESLLPGGYAMSLSADCAGTLQPGEQKICTVTNDDTRPTLIVIKHVINDDGGLQVASDWTMNVTGAGASPALFPGDEQGTNVSLLANSGYSVSESSTPLGYEATFEGDCEGNLLPGETATCTITNDDIRPTLVVIKHVINDNGGLQVASDWDFMVDGASASPASFAGNESGVNVSLLANQPYWVNETGPSGYAASASGMCASQLVPGETAFCTFTNDDMAPHLIVKKHVINDDGGTLTASNWTMNVTGTLVSPIEFPGDELGQSVALLANAPYSVNESGPLGYAASYSADCAGSLLPGETKHCTVTNDDIRPRLIVVKQVVNDDGGLQVAGDWNFTVEGGGALPSSFAGSELGVNVSLAAGAMFWVNETGPSGYAASAFGQCGGMLSPGQVAVCVFVNDDIRPRLHVIKHVVNDHGGLQVASDWTMGVNGTGVSVPSFAGSELGQSLSLQANAPYSVNESGPSGYAASYSADCAGSLLPGDDKTCTVTNDDIQPRLTVIKHVVNDDGGENTSAEWTMSVSGSNASPASFAGSELGTLVLLDAGPYSVSESATPAGYLALYDETCSGILLPGDNVTCRVTNDDLAPILWVIKHVINDDGGLNASAEWTMSVSGSNVSDARFPGSEAPGTRVTFDANAAYSVGESGPSGYAMSFGGDCSGILQPGDNKTCIVTNDDIEPTLLVIKHVVNDHGGINTSAEWVLSVSGPDAHPGSFAGSEAGTIVSLDANSLYSVDESGPSGYAMSLSADCSGTLQPGESKTCTVTNDDIQPKLFVIKHVVNDHGGLNASSEWTMGVSGPSSPSSFAGDELGTLVMLDANAAYAVNESGPAGYAASYSADCSGILQPGDERTCTVTNDDIQPTLLVVKHVVNDHGGQQVAADWLLTVTGADPSPSSFAGSEAGILVALDANSLYAVNESGPAGYAASYSVDCAGSLQPGDAKACTVTNDDIEPRLTVIKHVVNDDGGLQVARDWTMQVNGTSASPSSFAGDELGTLVALHAGSYQVTETGPSGYNATLSADCSGLLAPGDNKTCTLTNDDIAPLLLVKKHVVNDDGGALVATEWTMSISGTNVSNSSLIGSELGQWITLDANAQYNVTESGPFGYAGAASEGCAGTMLPGESKTCTWTNDDVAPELTVIKHVINDNGGTRVASEWTMEVDGANVSDPSFPGDEAGVTVTLEANAPYGVSEDGPLGYLPSFESSCSGTLLPGAKVSCTITNDDIAPKLLVKKVVVNDDGGPQVPGNWTMYVDGVAVSLASFPGNATGTLVTMNASDYDVTESLTPGGYAASFSAHCSGSMEVGDDKTCTVTNNDIRPELTVIKLVVNDHGGSLEAGDFDMHVTATGATPASFAGNASGTLVTMMAGAYSADEDVEFGYAKSLSADCSGTMLVGDKKTCTVTNNDIQPRLTIIKHVVNDDGQSKVASDFTMLVTGSQVSQSSFPGSESPGVTITLNAGPYDVDESYDSGYAKDRSEGCQDTISVGESRICVITNNDIGPTRTQGFWGQHTGFTIRIFDDHLDGVMTIGSGPEAKIIDSEAELFGAFLSDIKKESDREKRDPVEQARMQLAQQLAAARLNCAAFGCNQQTLDMLAEADDAYVGTDAALIIHYVGLVDAYNNSRDSMPITPTLGSWGKATPKDSRALADIPFWDETIS